MSADTAIRTIRLTERQARFLDEQVAAGRHPSESDVVQEALLRYEEELAEDPSDEELLAEAARGDADLAAGRFRDDDTPEEHASGIQRLLDKARVRAAAQHGND